MDQYHDDLLILKKIIFDKFNFKLSSLKTEEESSEYGACEFKLNKLSVKFRSAKITPTKNGQFVTLWKRSSEGPIEPFSETDAIDLILIATRRNKNFGHFVFPKEVLCKKGVMTFNGKEGKRAIRVYPPWDKAESAQAKKTQKWQLDFFIRTDAETQFIKKLYKI